MCYLHRLFILSAQPRNLKEDVWFEKESLPCIKITLDFNHKGAFWKNKKIRACEQKYESKKDMLMREDPCRLS